MLRFDNTRPIRELEAATRTITPTMNFFLFPLAKATRNVYGTPPTSSAYPNDLAWPFDLQQVYYILCFKFDLSNKFQSGYDKINYNDLLLQDSLAYGYLLKNLHPTPCSKTALIILDSA